jgi:cell wall-associated NlpC family hydrolase
VSKLPPGQKKFELFAINGLKMTADQAGKLWKKFSESNLGELANKAGTTRESFDKLASKGLGISTDAADKLWLHLRRQYLDELARKGNITKGRFIELAEKGLGYTRDKAQALWDTLNRQRLVDASRKAGETKTAFEHLAEKLGYSKQQADKLWDSLHRLTASGYTANVKVNAQGYVNVNGYQISAGAYFSPHAEGGFISGGIPNRDSVPAMLMPGEVVVPVRDVQAGAVDHLRGRLPGFAAGGVVSRPRAGIPGYAYGGKVAPGSKVGDTGDLHTNFPMQSFDAIGGFLKHSTVQIAAAATKAFARYVKSITAAGTGGSIVAYARSFLGKIPYQFGGTTLKGMDCSGFTGMVYRHAGYKSIPRTSEAQGMWAQKTDKPQTGGLAFYHSPAGGPDPGHVAIIDAGGKSVISQGGGLGPKIQRLRYMPLLWTGVPPGGFAQAKLAGGKGPAAAQAWMHSHLADYNWGENQWGSLQGLWDGESGWRWNARNPSSGAYGIPQCMDTHTKILTRRGWLGHDEVRTGDETIGYNQVTGKSEWTLVTDVLHPGPAEIMRFGISRWSVRSTPNHRWLMERLVNDKPVREEMIELQNHEGRKHRVVLSRPAHTEGTLDITVHEAALLGWIAGDGWQVQARVHPRKTPDRGRKNHHRPMTYYGVQVRAKRWDYFENLLQGDPHLTITRERDTGGGPKAPHGYGVREWRMSAPYARDLTERAGGNPKEAAVEQVLAMSTEQREAWLKTIMACDGYFGERHTQISQKEGPISDAVCLALYLSGKSPSVYKDERYENTVLTIGITEPYIGMRLAKIEPAGVTEVWCVRTDLGTWTAQQDGRIFLTGNSLPASKMASAGADWLTNPVTQMRWGASYIRSVYGNPNSAYTRWLGRHPHWYGEGGRIPGMAAGGTVAGLRATLAAEEASERAKYFGLVHSFAIGPAKYRTKTVTGELATLAKRQVTEQAAYAALAGKGLTTTRMHHLGATARAEALTAADQGLSKMPGGHPGWARDLRKYLGQISTTASGSVPAGSTGGQGALNLPTGKQLKFWLGAAQYGELRKYFGLAHSFAIGPAKYRTKTVMSELGTLAKRQASEAAAYKAVISGAMTNAELRHLGATARAEYGTAKDQALNKLPGGHPLFARDLRTYLAQISRLTGTLIPGSGVGASGGAAGGAGGSKPAGPPADSPGLRHIYGGDVGVFDSIAPVLAAAMAPFAKGGMARLARGGMLPVNSFDRGGMLPTGASIAWNGTGSPEPVGGGQCVTVTLEIAPGGNTAFEQLLHGMIRKYVRVRGGGSVQRAYSTPGRISGGVSWNTSG